MKQIHCLACRKNFDRIDENTKHDGGFESHRCPLCGYENTIEREIYDAPDTTDGGAH